MLETRYPCLDCNTFPWGDNVLKEIREPDNGCIYYLFWSKGGWSTSENEKYFLSRNKQDPVYYVDYPWGERAINVYRLCQKNE